MKYIVLIAALLTMAACSSKQSSDSQLADDKDVICKREKVLGSNIPQRVCTTKKQRREQERAAQRALESTSIPTTE